MGDLVKGNDSFNFHDGNAIVLHCGMGGLVSDLSPRLHSRNIRGLNIAYWGASSANKGYNQSRFIPKSKTYPTDWNLLYDNPSLSQNGRFTLKSLHRPKKTASTTHSLVHLSTTQQQQTCLGRC
eukprot:scaffold7863_cov37-Cyclotella_meneghiniana.AAC.9